MHFPALQGWEDTAPPLSVQLDLPALDVREQTSEKSFNYTWEIGATHLLKVFCMELSALLGGAPSQGCIAPPGKDQTTSDVDQN